MATACFQCILTVAESKRLIARGVVAMPCVQRALKDGMIAVCTGSTNSYIVEELLGRPIDKTQYLSGRTQPEGAGRAEKLPMGGMPDVVLRNGEPAEGLEAKAAPGEMSAGDVIIKGANALDYRARLAGVLIGHPEGGTVGATLGPAYGRKCHYLIPVGLEKELGGDMYEASEAIHAAVVANPEATLPSLWPLRGEIVTEIEALKALADVEVTPIGSGGIDGAEGSVRLLVCGEAEAVERAKELVRDVQGEVPFIEAPRPEPGT
ncbi:MAG: hypothetical protein PVH68_00230 [Armatimonadota bacterium]|jgi:hypothetical protein